MKKYKILSIIAAICICFAACGSDDNDSPLTPSTDTNFAKGADVGWLTQMEHDGIKFYNNAGVEMECMKLLKTFGINSIRMRVWVNPENGWNNKADVLAKAVRAQNLGMRVMIDFHYSDTWADPGHQPTPAAWASYNTDQMATAVADHTTEVLSLLKENGVDVDWIQVGNETTTGMLWELGHVKTIPSTELNNYAKFNNAGYDAAKAVYPNAKIILHIDNGYDNGRYRWLLDGMKECGAKWDVVGMSLYPTKATWKTLNESCLVNMKDMIERYGSEVMICEIGMDVQDAEDCKDFIADIVKKTASLGEKGLGVFYWEPECYGAWQGYTKGAFDDSGKPTVALEGFK